MNKVETMPIGVIVEKRKATSPWLDAVWKPVEVIAGRPETADWTEMRAGEQARLFYAGTAPLELHRKDAEAYHINLENREPVVYVVLEEAEDGPAGLRLARVSAAPYEAENYLASGSELVEGIAMPDVVRAFVEDFVKAHYTAEPFYKRKRDKAKAIERQVFGKDPIHARTGRYARDAPSGGEAGDDT